MATRNKRVPIPLPIRGLNTVEPFNIGIDSGYARELTNYYIKDGRLVMRPGIESEAFNFAAFGAVKVAWIDVTTAATGFEAILQDGRIRNIQTGAGAGTIGGTAGYGVTTVAHAGAGGSLSLLIGAREPRNSTAPFAVAGPTPASFASTAVTSACSHKGRLYYAGSGAIVDYTNPGVIAGAMPNTFDFSQFLSGQIISRIFSVTITPNASTENVLVIFGSGGRVLVYAGDHPNAANASLIGKFDMPAPAGRVGFAEVDGDVFVTTAEYCYWVRDLISTGAQSAYENSPTKPIQGMWQSLTWVQPTSVVVEPYAVYIAALDLILCSPVNKGLLPTTFDYESDRVILAYHKTLGAWSLWGSAPFAWPVIAVSGSASNVAYGTNDNAQVLSLNPTLAQDAYSSGATQSNVLIETSWKTPYFAAFEGVGNKVNSVRVWFENTISGYFEKVRAIFDYSDYNVSLGWYTQSTVTAVNPANYGDGKEDGANQASNQYHPIIGASGAGGGVSFQFTQKAKSGSSTTQNQSIYAATAYIEEAGELW